MRIIAFIDDPNEVGKMLTHLGEPTAPPKLAPARGPPLWKEAGPGGVVPNAGCQHYNEASQYAGSWLVRDILNSPVSPVPAPPAFILMLTGLGVLGLTKRFRKET